MGMSGVKSAACWQWGEMWGVGIGGLLGWFAH